MAQRPLKGNSEAFKGQVVAQQPLKGNSEVSKGQVFSGQEPNRRIYYHSLSGQLSATCSNATEVAQWATPSCSRPKRPLDELWIFGKVSYVFHTLLPGVETPGGQ